VNCHYCDSKLSYLGSTSVSVRPAGRVTEKKITKQHLGGSLHWTDSTQSCMVGNVYDVITCAKFEIEIFIGYDFKGIEFSIFLLIFAWALQQCSANALPVIPRSLLFRSQTSLMVGP